MHHAMLAVPPGRCEVALIGYASRQRTRRSRKSTWRVGRPAALGAQFEAAATACPRRSGTTRMIAARHMHQYGTTLRAAGRDRGRRPGLGRS